MTDESIGALLDKLRASRGRMFNDASGLSDIKQTLENITKTFEDFKAANDERLADLEKGQRDVVTDEKVDRINDAVSNLKDELGAKIIEANDRLDSFELELQQSHGLGPTSKEDGLSDYERMNIANWAGKRVEELDKEDIQNHSEYRNAFLSMIRNGQRAGQGVFNALSVGSDPDGGYWVPAQTSARMIRRLFETSPMRQVATIETVGVSELQLPKDVNDATSGGWVGETESRSVTATPEVGMQKIPVHEQFAMPKATQTLLDDATIDVEAWLSMKIADKLARTENTAFVSGNGGDVKPRGFLDYSSGAVTTDDDSRSWGVLQYVATGSSGGFPTDSSTADDANPLVDVISKLKPDFRTNARWFMNRAAEATIRKMKDGDGRYLVGFGNLQDAALGFSLLNFPITNFEDMPDIAADSFSVAFGDMMQGYTIVDRIGIRVLRDPFTDKPFVRFYTTKRVGGDVVNFDALKLLKFGTS